MGTPTPSPALEHQELRYLPRFHRPAPRTVSKTASSKARAEGVSAATAHRTCKSARCTAARPQAFADRGLPASTSLSLWRTQSVSQGAV